ncbi:site-specific integrase [Jiangella rhizosphaerae]|uniref:Site-specific integrase n=1 Tax=Jiangella rhizosphaerae TaxID=2293569 RepID=A0A418KGM7_9ACTN|nr:site-specific integrase [Jiangella rhizosphaerae]RIQ11128.1 site-specific integrase [Jiangella rhizosphaerae]
MAGRRPFGKVRKLPSGRFQASFIGPNGRRQNAPNTFGTKTDADRWLARVRADISRGTWLDEQLGRRTFQEYAEAYLTDNPDVGQRWAETCRRNMRLHMVTLLDVPLVAITPPVVRSWYSNAIRGTGGKTSIAQSYRFLRAVLNAAVRDDAITRNPCMIPGAGSVKSPERKIATPDQVAELITTISSERYRAAVVLAAWCALRRGEVCAMRREDVNLTKGTVWVRENHVELLESPVRYNKEPKTPAGKREISVPPHVLTFLVQHAERGPAPSGSSSAATASRCGATPSTRRSCERGPRSASISRSTTCGTPGKVSRRPPAPRSRTSRSGSGTPQRRRPTGTFTPWTAGTPRSQRR